MITEVDPNKVYPMIVCADTWPRAKLDKIRMNTYKELEKIGLIRIQKVRYSHANQLVAIEYLSTVPIEWARDQMRETYRNLLAIAQESDRNQKPSDEQLTMGI